MEKHEGKRVRHSRYDDQFKADAVRHLIESGKTIKSAAEVVVKYLVSRNDWLGVLLRSDVETYVLSSKGCI